ncbi:MAG: hypothetical protein NWE91_04790 [Candidatus Bathyarchaeota archaeon]|nr:hypothetical protein [Candidatus Bathyarchaeota archaeon]
MSQKFKFRHIEYLGICARAHQKGEFSTFNCQTHIPVPVDMEKQEAKFKKGILEVRLPRKKGYEIKIE